MQHSLPRRVLVALAAPLLLLASPAVGTARADDPEDVLQTPEEALRDDLTATAEARGWTFAQAEAQYRVAEAMDDIASQIAPERLDVFVGTALSERPGGTPTLYLKGEADEFVQRVVDASGQDVIVADRQPFSFLELQARSERVNRELIALGYADLSSGVDITNGTITVDLAAQPGLTSDPAEIRERLSAEFQRGVALTVADALDNTVQFAYGGMAAYKDGVVWCTMGWTVVDPQGVTGLSTAGHCPALDPMVGKPGWGFAKIEFEAEHRGFLGDVEWHTTSTVDVTRFYAKPFVKRDTVSVEPWWEFSEGETICVFGRATNERNCERVVNDIVASCTLQGFLTEGLVRMDGVNTDGGDSGGGWSYDNRAYGSHVGICGWGSVFTRADVFPQALGVSVLLK
jgi:hypothetical protein